MPPTSSCSRRQPRWDSRPSNNRHAKPRRMPEARLTMKFVRACSKVLCPSVSQVKSTLPPIKTILIAKSDLLAEIPQAHASVRLICGSSASSRKCAAHLRNFPQAHSSVRGVCGTFRKFLASVRGVCGTFRKLTQVCGAFAELSASLSQVCGTFAELSASLSQVCGAFAELSASSLKRAGFAELSASMPLFLKIDIICGRNATTEGY